MNAPDNADGRPRTRFLSSRLWLLSAALGATTIYYSGAAIHDNTRGRAAVTLVAKSMAEHVSALANARLEVLAAPTFAPVTRPQALVPGGWPASLQALVREQQEGERCKCRELFPVLSFFRVDAATGAVAVAAMPDGARDAPVATTLLAELANKDKDTPRDPQHAPIRLRGDPRLSGRMIVTFVQYDDRGGAVAVYGLVASARDLIATVFGGHAVRASAGDSGVVLAHLDSMSLRVATADSAALFGTLSADRHYRGAVRPGGALEGVAVTVALKPSQIPVPLMVLLPQDRLWRLGLLMLCTIIVIAIAVGSSRRELLLARARSDFLAGVSHDFRMPLAQILLAGETLALDREHDGTEQRRLARAVVREARRLSAVVDNVLFFSRSGAVELRPHLQPVGVAALFADVVESVHLAADDAEQAIDAGADALLSIQADRDLIRQALVNLVDNALKYGKPGQCIRLTAERSGADRVRVYVDDQGPGIPQSERARVFEPYERLSRDQVSERTGTGLGLAVVSQIASVCGGRVWIDDAPAGGTRVALELALSKPT